MMHKIYCDETWTADHLKLDDYYIVFHGVLVREENEPKLLEEIDCFKRKRGLYKDGKPVEIKWTKSDQEWKNAQRVNGRSRYEEFLNVYFRALRNNELSFGIMYLKKSEFERVEADFVRQRQETKHDFFFMMYFQFLYHCFLKNQVKESPCQIFIDTRDLGAEGNRYDPNKLMEILNRRIYREAVPKDQPFLTPQLRKKLSDSIRLVDMGDSKQEPLIQMADLCAGCVRYILENKMQPPSVAGQLGLFDTKIKTEVGDKNRGKEELATSFYRKLRSISGYEKINLLDVSYHYRFSIFPFQFHKKI